jgi:hypothetical protein
VDERLFEGYCRGSLTDFEKRRLAERLTEPSVARRFARFVQEWTLIAECCRKGIEKGLREP